MLAIGMLLGGAILLFVGGELLIRGAARLAAAAGISPLVAGLTVVAFSTSAPELAVTLKSVQAGQAGLAVGNVVGSNIANVLLILGMSALVAPLVVEQKLIRLDVPLMVALSIIVWGMAADGRVAAWEGALLVVVLLTYVAFSIKQSRRESRAVQQEYEQEYGSPSPPTRLSTAMNIGLVAGGIGLLVLGANALVEGAVSIARSLGLSDLVIGLTVIAIGTSLPELATSIIATARGERDIAVGNVVGSNIFNLLSVLGLTSLFAPGGLPAPAVALHFDIPVMIAAAMACLPVFFSDSSIARWEGGLFIGYYLAYLAYLVLTATHHEALPVFNLALFWFVIPLTAVTLTVVTAGEVRARRRSRQRA